MKNHKNKFILAITSLFLILTSLSFSQPVLAATPIIKGGSISGNTGYRIRYDASPSWYLIQNAGMSSINVGGSVGYCIEPMVSPIDTTSATSVPLSSLTEGKIFHIPGNPSNGKAGNFKISNEQKRNITLIANYGFGYPGHNTTAYRWATQWYYRRNHDDK